MALGDTTFTELLDQLAARRPAPGGGSAAAWTAATAAALVEMAAAFASPGRGTSQEPIAELQTRVAALRGRLLELAEEDTRSYQPVLDALALEPSDSRRDAVLQAALSAAAEVPLAIATAASEVATLAATAARAGGAHLVGDATTAAVLAEAATRAAVRLVELNLARAPEDPRLRLASELAQRAWPPRAQTLTMS